MSRLTGKGQRLFGPQVSLQATFIAIFRHFLHKGFKHYIDLFSEISRRDMDNIL
jgi:hypothetical protein